MNLEIEQDNKLLSITKDNNEITILVSKIDNKWYEADPFKLMTQVKTVFVTLNPENTKKLIDFINEA